ncbi:MAG: phytoene desaturase [Kiritimatiellae bacterium]|jgi:phytoene desaturase|nr:phytoene desaturase [Kiritimatiellia bacterium]HPC19939.1 phytoene desaturase family protein [Kiritimatiellia bacterium]
MNSRRGARIVVVGAGIGGLAAAARLAKDGFSVTVIERNDQAGGRARLWKLAGYTFDMGPSWYLMPDAFERFFAHFGRQVSDYYKLRKLDPAYRVFFGPGQSVDIPADRVGQRALFDRLEPGGGGKLDRYLDAAAYKYRVAVDEFLYRDYHSVFDFLNWRMMTEGLKLNVLGKLDAAVRRQFSDRRARQILEYGMVFLGTAPTAAPALYALMSHVDLTQGVFYPMGGLATMARGIQKLAEEQGVQVMLNTEAVRIVTERGRAVGVQARGADGAAVSLPCDAVLANADYAHVETELLTPADCSFPRRYWERRVVAPTLLLLYLGINRRLHGLLHHNLYFKPDWDGHFNAIFRRPAWPEEPCFNVSCISKTDPGMAPPGCENMFVLVPVAAGLDDTDEVREAYADRIIRHLERMTGEAIAPHIQVRRIYSHRDYAADYHAWQGTALGLAHTLMQTAVFRPPLRSRKVRNLHYAGQYTHPGIGVPMVLIAAEVVAGNILRDHGG